MHLYLYTDGASRGNPGHAAVGIIVEDNNHKTITEISRYIGITTNNVAEYKAVLIALEIAKELHAEDVTLYVDSELISRQLKRQYRVKSINLQPLYASIVAIAGQLKSFSVIHVNRNMNKKADKLANYALDNRQSQDYLT